MDLQSEINYKLKRRNDKDTMVINYHVSPSSTNYLSLNQLINVNYFYATQKQHMLFWL